MDWSHYSVLLLDLDGTLVDTEPIHCAVHQELLLEQGIDLAAAEIYTNIGAGDRHFYAELMARFGIDGDPLAWCEEKDRRMHQRYRRGGLQLQAGVRELLDFSDAQRIPRAVVTSSRRETAGLALAGAGIAARFPIRVCWEDTSEHKPHPAPYRLGLERLEATAPQAIAIEDSVPGVIAARSAGCQVIAVSHLVGADLLREAGAAAVVTDLRAVLP